MDEFASLLDGLPPEALEQLLGLGTLDERGGMLEDQLAQAMALRKPSDIRHTTGLGAAGGAIAGTINGITSALQEKDLRAKQEELMGKKDAGRKTLVDLLRQRQSPQPPMMSGLGPIT